MKRKRGFILKIANNSAFYIFFTFLLFSLSENKRLYVSKSSLIFGGLFIMRQPLKSQEKVYYTILNVQVKQIEKITVKIISEYRHKIDIDRNMDRSCTYCLMKTTMG